MADAGEVERGRNRTPTAEHGSGTTIVLMVWRDSILCVSDGRSSTYSEIVKNNGRSSIQKIITSGHSKKLRNIDGKYIGAIVGDSSLGGYILDTICDGLDEKKGIEEIMASLREEYIDNWKSVGSWENIEYEKFPSVVGIIGFDDHGNPQMILLGDNVEEPLNIKVGETIVRLAVIGSGKSLALEHFRDIVENKPFHGKEEAVAALKECVACAGIRDPNTGGHFQFATLEKGGKVSIHKERPHLIYYLASEFKHLAKYFGLDCVFFVTLGISHEDLDEGIIRRHVKKKFEGVGKIKILGIQPKSKITIRLVEFISEEKVDAALQLTDLKAWIPPDRGYLKPDSKIQSPLRCRLGKATKKRFEEFKEEFKENSKRYCL